MPATIVSREGVQLVDDDRVNVTEEPLMIRAHRNQNGFERFGGRQQHIWWIVDDTPPL